MPRHLIFIFFRPSGRNIDISTPMVKNKKGRRLFPIHEIPLQSQDEPERRIRGIEKTKGRGDGVGEAHGREEGIGEGGV